MNKINLQGILRSLSIILIFLIVLLYIVLNVFPGDIYLESGNSQLRKKYEYIDRSKIRTIPDFTHNLELLFLKHQVQAIVKTKIVTESIPPSASPSLKFVGMIETDNKIIYSFRNMDTNRILLLEKGVEVSGIILLATHTQGYILKNNEITFQVGKK